MPHRGMVLGGRSGHFLRSHRFACGQRPSKHQKAAMQCNTLSCSTNRGLPKRKSRWHFSTGTVNGISVHQARDMRCTNAAIHEMCNGAGGVHSRWLSEVRTERRVGHCIAGRAGGEGIAGGCIALQGVALNCVARRSMAGQAGPGPGWARDCTALHCTALESCIVCCPPLSKLTKACFRSSISFSRAGLLRVCKNPLARSPKVAKTNWR
mmetsp:Transcript_31278/g.50659  ORF Transcript_31278/g.50659 Transcript_31278/m.50659 type:complete len:209 (+) Transcript_31278:611-1237(+)